MSFTETFGGDTINPTMLSYADYSIGVNLITQWPFQAALDADENGSALASKIGVEALTTGLSVYFPDATVASVGQDVLVYNTGTNAFTVRTTTGVPLGTVASGEAWYFYITDNTTADGEWQVFQFGMGTSSATAASLAGSGLVAFSSTLNQNLITTSLLGAYSVTGSDRSTILRNSGGSVVYSFAQCGSGTGQLPGGWFVYVVNNGAGNITLTPFAGQLIDGVASKVISPTETCMVFSDGSELWSFGFGQSIVSTVTGTTIFLSASGIVTLNATQIASQIQDYAGALLVDVTINYGTGVGYWFIWNNTTGAHNVTARVNAADVGVVVPQTNFTILRSNGSNMQVAFTAATGSVSLINTTAGEIIGGPITSTGTLGLANTTVVAGHYNSFGPAGTVAFNVDAKGRLTAVTEAAISIDVNQVNVFTSTQLEARVSDPTGVGELVFANAPSLQNPAVTTQAFGNNSTLAASTAFVQSALSGYSTASVSLTNKTIDGALNTITDVSLATGVTGTLPISHGGTSVTSFPSVLATNGYQTLINGFVIQYGQVTVGPFTFATITYPIAFTSGARSIQVTPVTAVSAGAPQAYVTPLSNSQFNINNPDGVVTMTYFWMALGY